MNNWSGTFESKQYGTFLWMFPMVYGKIYIELPKEIDLTSTFETTGQLHYSGLYKMGETSEFKFSYENNKYIGKSTTCNQELTLELYDFTDNTIIGNYLSQNPADNGIFKIQKY
jgi:hypothetical protein